MVFTLSGICAILDHDDNRDRHSYTDGRYLGLGVNRCRIRSFIFYDDLYFVCFGYLGYLTTPLTIPTALESTNGCVKYVNVYNIHPTIHISTL